MNQGSAQGQPASSLALSSPGGLTPGATEQPGRMAAIFDAHFADVWRFLRRVGVPVGDLDDCAQEVMLITSRKLGQVEFGKEKGFVLGVAYRVGTDARRARARRRELEEPLDEEWAASDLDPEMLTQYRSARAALDQILDGMPLDFRAVFVLAELDELSMTEIARVLDIPAGTVASRLRRSRQYFDSCVRRLKARLTQRGGLP